MAKTWDLTIGIDASRATTSQQTGTERYSRRIIDAVLEIGSAHRFRLYVNAGQALRIPMRAGDTQRLIPFPRLWTHARLSTELLLNPVDRLFVPAHVIPPVHPAGSVVTIHDLGYLYEPDAHRSGSRRYLDLSTRWSVRAASRVIAISTATRNDLINYYGVDERKIQVIHHGVDEQFRRPAPEEIAQAKRRLDLPEQYILHVGTLQPRKNIGRLVQAFNRIAADLPELRLILAGKPGWLFSGIEQVIQSSPFGRRIEIRGHMPDQDLPAVYAGASALAFPSLYEGFGLPALEAMACGTPTLVSDRGALPEIAGDAAQIVDPLDVGAIAAGLRAVLSSSGRERRIEAGLRQVAKFTWRMAGKQTLELIERADQELR